MEYSHETESNYRAIGNGTPKDEHTKDEDCTVDPFTNQCKACGVYHGDPCPYCHGRGFHNTGCS